MRKNKTSKKLRPSRREVQRRFSPGTFVMTEASVESTVIGWAPVAPDINPKTGRVRQVARWEVLLLSSRNTLIRWPWETMISKMNFNEWEDWVTTP